MSKQTEDLFVRAGRAANIEPEIMPQAVSMSPTELRDLANVFCRWKGHLERFAELKEGVRAPEARN